MKRLVVLAAVVALSTWACGGAGGSTPDTGRRLKFALIPKALDIPVFDYANIGAQREAKVLGDVDVIYRGPDHSDVLKQKETLESFITQKVDGIAISVLSADALTPTIDKAVEAGIPVVTWDSDAPASKRFAFWGVDDFAAGQVMGKAAAELLNGKGTVAFITSNGATNLARRLDGVKDILKNYPDIRVIDTFDVQEDSVRCSALIAAGSNRYPDLGAWISVGGWPVFTQNALAPVPSNTKVISFDTNPPAPDLVKAGKAQVLIGQKYFGWGSETVKLLHDAVKGKYPAIKIIDSGVDVVNAKTVDDYIALWNKMAAGK
jgi:ribose transport system substrate-binding protein